MKTLLIKPYNLSDHIQPSIGLGYLATSVRNRHDVKILDCIKEGITIDKLPSFIKDYKPDIVGLQCYTFDVNFIREALSLIKKIDKNIVTVVGGPHPTATSDKMLDTFKNDLDFLFVGEAEVGFPRLLDHLNNNKKDLGDVPGLVWRNNGKTVANPRVFTENLDSLDMPAWDLIHPETYPEAQHGAFFKQFPIAPIMVTRGCPYPCTFCAGGVVAGKKIRRRSIDNVLKELSTLNKKFGIREFHVIDDNFTMDKAYAKEFLRRLKELNLGMSWAVPNGVRMDSLDDELLKLMKETGLYLISLGIESGSDDVLKSMKKGITTSRIRECVKMIKRHGIDIAGFFIIGFPGETLDTINKTINFSIELGLNRANFFTYLPFPGSESFDELKKSGELDNVDWDRFYFMTGAYVPKGMTRKELKKMHRKAFAKFYLRPGIVWYHIRCIKSLRHLSFLTKRFFHWIVMG